jgi:hypothetical protein
MPCKESVLNVGRGTVPINPDNQSWILPLLTRKLARRKEVALGSAVQDFVIAHPMALRVSASHRVIADARNAGNRKRVARIMREDNLLAVLREIFTPRVMDHGYQSVFYHSVARR